MDPTVSIGYSVIHVTMNVTDVAVYGSACRILLSVILEQKREVVLPQNLNWDTHSTIAESGTEFDDLDGKDLNFEVPFGGIEGYNDTYSLVGD